jgi:carbamoyl-phosphate synthase small subunit
MIKVARLVLADGSVYEGLAFGAETDAFGEVVFNTSMIGYQETLTDPSYAGQIVLPTYPIIGNYGINEQDIESNRIQVSGFVVREECLEPNHYQSFESDDGSNYQPDDAQRSIGGIKATA